MKIFHFDPTTGRRGEFIEHVRRMSWASTGVAYATENGDIAPIEYVEPVGFGGNAEVTIHTDAGLTDNQGNDISYRHDTEWHCFCQGEMVCGTDTYWDWVILPPSNLVHKTVNCEEKS